MYSVHTPTRQSRPRWATAASAALLLITVGLAQGLIHLKGQGQHVPLDQPQLLERGHLTCALPAGWERHQRQEQTSGVIVALTEPVVDGRPGRQLWIQRGAPDAFGVPSQEGRLFAQQALRRVARGSSDIQDEQPATLGGFPAWEVTIITVPSGSREPLFGVARAALAPGGQTVSITLFSPDRIRAADRQLVEQISRAVVLHDVTLEEDSAPSFQNAGVKFTVPSGARFVAARGASPASAYLFGGTPGATWYLHIARLPLIADRRPADLVTDCALGIQQKPGLPDPVKTEQLDGREVAHLALASAIDDKPKATIWAVRLDKDSACVLLGRHDSDAAQAVQDVCRSIATSARPIGDTINVQLAIETGRKTLAAMSGEELDRVWSALPTVRSYRHRAPGVVIGRAIEQYEARSSGGKAWWDIVGQARLEPFLNFEVKLVEQWSIRSDLAAHEHRFQRSIEDQSTLQYEEQRQAGTAQVVRKVTVPKGGIRSTRTPIDDIYAPDPVLVQAAGQLALGDGTGSAIFTTTETFSQNTVYCIVTPLGEVELPASDGRAARAVRLQRDYDPAPLLLYYNRAGLLISVAISDGSWREIEGSTGSAS